MKDGKEPRSYQVSLSGPDAPVVTFTAWVDGSRVTVEEERRVVEMAILTGVCEAAANKAKKPTEMFEALDVVGRLNNLADADLSITFDRTDKKVIEAGIAATVGQRPGA